MKKSFGCFLVVLLVSSSITPVVVYAEESTKTTNQEQKDTESSGEVNSIESFSALTDLSGTSTTTSTQEQLETTESSENTVSSEEEAENTEDSNTDFDPYFPINPSEDDILGDAVIAGQIPLVGSFARVNGSVINNEIISNVASGVFKRPSIKQDWRTYSMFPYETNRPLGIVVHETANPNSTIEGEIAYMDRNWQNAFVHAFADQNQVIEIHDPSYGAWGAGRIANKYFIHVELVEHVGNRTAFMKSLLNDAYYIAVKLQQFGLTPSRPSGIKNDVSGTIWSHAEVTSYLGGTNHTDPNGYFAQFGYTMADFYSLIQHEYNQLDKVPPVMSGSISNIDSNTGTFKVNINASASSGIKLVEVPVWTQDNQSDLRWLRASKQADGSYSVVVNSNDFTNKNGPFNIHAYATSNVNLKSSIALEKVTFDREPAKITNAKIQNINNQTGTFDIVATIQAPANGLKSVRVPVWSKADQSDIYWYDASLQSDGTYKATMNIQNHKNSEGPYRVHFYATTNQNIQTSVDAGTASFDLPDPSITTTITDTNGMNTEFLISTELANFYGVSGVRFPVWSNINGQDDIRWYTATYNATTKRWEARVKVADHKDSGKYNVHTYVDFSNGTTESYGTDGFTVQSLDITGGFTVKENGKAQIDIQVPTNLSITEVRVPIWSKANQSDLKWYTAESLGNGKYRVNFDFVNHNLNVGNYTVHVYATASNGLNRSVSFGKMMIKRPNFSLDTTITDVKGNNEEYLISANVNNYPGIKSVRFPVWSNTNGQDDIRWYTATYNATTKRWEARVKVADHKDSGKYNVHAYVDFSNGTTESYGTDGFTVQSLDITGGFTVKENGKAQIDIQVPTNLSITEVRVPIWSKANQSDLKWYTAESLGNGKYRVNFDFVNHNLNVGNYTVHVYATASNGLNRSVSFGKMMIKRPNFSLDTTITDVKGNNEEYLISANVNNYPGIKSVRFPVWSNTNGQDDIRWYTAT
ncbi:GBS Bsp-like repeat-containing protein, partial [Enterococcus sp. LJL120]